MSDDTVSRFQTFDLHPLLPDGVQLVLDHEQDVMVQLCGGEVIELQRFTQLELAVAIPFLENYPEYCPHEIVLSAMTGKSIERCRARISASLEGDISALDAVMRPVRNLLGRTRMKLRPFEVNVKALPNMGYLLVPLGKREKVRT